MPLRLILNLLPRHTVVALALSLPAYVATPVFAAEISSTIRMVKPSIVGIGTFQRTRSPAIRFIATGFATADGLSVISNAHSIPELAPLEVLGVVSGSGTAVTFRPATVAGLDREHDLAHLRLSGAPLRPMPIGDSSAVAEGRDFAFTGFPLGMALGLNHATHRAMLSAITPVVMPASNPRGLSPRVVAQLQKSSFSLFQLDGTAYPGNSGSPLYDPETGIVYGVMNMVLLKGMKEAAISNPSGISYAIPATHIRTLLERTSD